MAIKLGWQRADIKNWSIKNYVDLKVIIFKMDLKE